MKEYDEFKFNSAQERAWEWERFLEQKSKENEEKNKAKEGKEDVEDTKGWEQIDGEECKRCLSGEMPMFCHVCRFGD